LALPAPPYTPPSVLFDADPLESNNFDGRLASLPSTTTERNVEWTFEVRRIFRMPTFPAAEHSHARQHEHADLRLRSTAVRLAQAAVRHDRNASALYSDMSRRINVLTGVDYWLDGLMCNVPEVLMCYHLDGIVQKYDMVKTGASEWGND